MTELTRREQFAMAAMRMTFEEAYTLLKANMNEPVFNVKIGIGSPQVTNVDLESAIAEMSRCSCWTTEFMEYVFIYASGFHKDEENLNKALTKFNLGAGRGGLNQKDGIWT